LVKQIEVGCSSSLMLKSCFLKLKLKSNNSLSDLLHLVNNSLFPSHSS